MTGRTLANDSLGRAILEGAIYDPSSTRVVNGARVRDVFPGNINPKDRQDPVALKIQAMIPQPSRAGNINNWAQSVPRPKTQDIPSIKIDQNFGSNGKMAFYWSRYRSDVISPANPDGLPDPLTTMRPRRLRTYTYRLTHDHSITPTLLVHAGVGFLRYYNPDSAPPSSFEYDAVKELGLVGALSTGFPRIGGLNAAQGGMSLTMGPTNGNLYYNDKPTAVASATWVRGNHTIKTGEERRIDIWTDRNIGGTTGHYTFAADQTTLPSTQGQNLGGGTVGFPYASFLLGAVSSTSINNPQDPQLRKPAWGLYLPDTWKMTRRLTLDFGIRWDYEAAPHEGAVGHLSGSPAFDIPSRPCRYSCPAIKYTVNAFCHVFGALLPVECTILRSAREEVAAR